MKQHFSTLGAGDLNTKYRESVVRVDGLPFLINEINSVKHFNGYWLHDMKQGLQTIRQDLDSTPFQLGYQPVSERGIFFTRKPIRLYKQGLSHRALSVTRNNSDKRHPTRFDWGNSKQMKHLHDTIMGAHMSFDDALQSVSDFENPACAAFDRDFAVQMVDEDLELFYRGRSVGRVDDGNPRLNPEFFFLNEVLDKRINAA